MAAIAFPRALPDALSPVSLSFYGDPMLEVTPLRSGDRIALDFGPTLWRGRWQSPSLDEADFGVVRAWYDTLTSVQSFYGYDALREYPLAYAGGWGDLTIGGVPFDGTCTLQGVASSKLLDLADLPAGFVLSPGDYLAFDYGASRALHRIAAGGTAGSDGKVVVEVRPHVRPGWQPTPPAPRTVLLHKPAAEMQVLPGTWSEGAEAARHGRVSFEAVQVL